MFRQMITLGNSRLFFLSLFSLKIHLTQLLLLFCCRPINTNSSSAYHSKPSQLYCQFYMSAIFSFFNFYSPKRNDDVQKEEMVTLQYRQSHTHHILNQEKAKKKKINAILIFLSFLYFYIYPPLAYVGQLITRQTRKEFFLSYDHFLFEVCFYIRDVCATTTLLLLLFELRIMYRLSIYVRELTF